MVWGQKTSLNIKTTKKEDKGFYYLEELGLSIQGVEKGKCLYEIALQCIENVIKINMEIKSNECIYKINM